MTNKPLPDKCAVTRDLMPLCVDGTASEASQRRVKKHVSDCPPCDKVWQEMQTQIDLDVPDQAETQQFDTAVKKVKHKHVWRKLRNVLLGVVLALLVCAGAAYGYYWYFVEEVPLPVDLYEMELALRSPSGEETPVIIKTANMPRAARVHVEIRYDGAVMDENNWLEPSWVMYIWATTTRSTNLEAGGCTDYKYYAFDRTENDGEYLVNGQRYNVNVIYKGTADGDQVLLHKEGMNQLKWTAPSAHDVLRSVPALNVVGEELVPISYKPFATLTPTVPPMATYPAGGMVEAQSTPTPMPTSTPRHTLRP